MTTETDLDCMSPEDTAAWQSATSVVELGQLMAAWLEGDIKSWPGYEPGAGPEEETNQLIFILASLNRAGFLTTVSQPGQAIQTEDGRWEQRAAVSGFISDPTLVERLTAAAAEGGIIVSTGDAVPVSLDDGEPFTWFGQCIPEEDFKFLWRDHISELAWAELRTAQEITFIEPNYGPSGRVWWVLETAIAEMH